MSKTNPGPLLSNRGPLTYQTSDLHSCRERTEREVGGGGVNIKGMEEKKRTVEIQGEKEKEKVKRNKVKQPNKLFDQALMHL